MFWLLNKLGLPITIQQTVVHVAIVFLVAFGGQMIGASLGAFNWPTLSALVVSALAAGISAVIHYLIDLVPTPTAKAAAKRDANKA